MGVQAPVVIGLGIALLAYVIGLVGLVAAGHRIGACSRIRPIVACLRLPNPLTADPRVPWPHKPLLAAAVGYLLLPVDIVPDFIPAIGFLDDAFVAALAVRLVLRRAGPEVVTEHWAGPPRLLPALLRLADVSLQPRISLPGWTTAAGALGVGVCVWVDIADNCATCAEEDPLLLSGGRGAAVTLCALGAISLAARWLVAWRSAGSHRS